MEQNTPFITQFNVNYFYIHYIHYFNTKNEKPTRVYVD